MVSIVSMVSGGGIDFPHNHSGSGCDPLLEGPKIKIRRAGQSRAGALIQVGPQWRFIGSSWWWDSSVRGWEVERLMMMLMLMLMMWDLMVSLNPRWWYSPLEFLFFSEFHHESYHHATTSNVKLCHVRVAYVICNIKIHVSTLRCITYHVQFSQDTYLYIMMRTLTLNMYVMFNVGFYPMRIGCWHAWCWSSLHRCAVGHRLFGRLATPGWP